MASTKRPAAITLWAITTRTIATLGRIGPRRRSDAMLGTTALVTTLPQVVERCLERPRYPLELNPVLDRAALANDFRQHGRLHIQSVFNPPSADHLHRCLANETRYSLCANLGGVARAMVDLSPQERQDCSIDEWRVV